MRIAVLPERKKVSLVLDPDLKQELEKMAKAKNRSINNLIETICWLAVQEEKELLKTS